MKKQQLNANSSQGSLEQHQSDVYSKSKAFDSNFNPNSAGSHYSSLVPPKPEEIDLELFGKITADIENQFRASIGKVEAQFREQVHEIKSVFYDKVQQFKQFNEMIQSNHEQISKSYDITQRKLLQKMENLQREKSAWQDERRMVQSKNSFGSEVLSLNVGGTHNIMVSQKVLTSVPGSTLEKMFSGMHELTKVDEGSIFLDRDGRTFQVLINFLRNDRRVYPEFDNSHDQKQFTEELNYWGIKDDSLEVKRLETKFPPDVVDMLKCEPGDEIDFGQKNAVQDSVRQTWNMIGPLRLIDIVKNSKVEIDFECRFGKTIDKYKTHSYGQMNPHSNKVEGIARQIFADPNSHVYEGQVRADGKRMGYGRQIYCDGNYYIGYWKDDKKNGQGKKVYIKTGKIEEGVWEDGEFRG